MISLNRTKEIYIFSREV